MAKAPFSRAERPFLLFLIIRSVVGFCFTSLFRLSARSRGPNYPLQPRGPEGLLRRIESFCIVATVYWTPRQAEFIDALVELGYYGTQTEVGRAAVEKLIRDLSAHQRREIALRLYEKGHATVSRVAEIADIPVEQARSLVKEAGLLREGTEESLTDRRGKVRAAAKRLR